MNNFQTNILISSIFRDGNLLFMVEAEMLILESMVQKNKQIIENGKLIF